MQKMMILMKVSPVMEREFTTSNNEVRKVKYRMLTLDDGIDSIYGETSEALCNRIDTTNEQNRLQLVEGHLYNVDFTLRAREYKDKNGNDNTFLSCTISKMSYIL